MSAGKAFSTAVPSRRYIPGYILVGGKSKEVWTVKKTMEGIVDFVFDSPDESFIFGDKVFSIKDILKRVAEKAENENTTIIKDHRLTGQFLKEHLLETFGGRAPDVAEERLADAQVL